MTDDGKAKIRRLRLEGTGYKAIAGLLGLSRDSVRRFCKNNGLEDESCVVALNMSEKLKRKYCSHSCYIKSRFGEVEEVGV